MSTMLTSVAAILTIATAPDGAHDEVSLEIIRLAYSEGRDSDVVLLCDRALLERGGETPRASAEVHFWRGAALRRLKRHEEALLALDAAARSGHRTPELHVEQALALSATGKPQEAERELNEARRLLQEDPEKRALLEERWRGREDKPERFEARIRPQFGYDTNIVAVNDETLLADDVDRESFYYGLALTARYRVLEHEGRVLTLEYLNASRVYANESDLSFMDNTLSLTGRIPLRDSIDFMVRAGYSEAFLADDGHFRTLRSVGPGFLVRPASSWEVRLWGEWGDADYYTSAPDEQDRDGSYQQVGFAFRVDLGAEWAVNPVLLYVDHDAEGSDYERREWQPGVTIAMPAIGGIRPALALTYVKADFDNPNSLTSFAEERRDRRLCATVTLTFHTLEELVGFAPSVSIRFEDWDSNIDAYDFKHWQPQIDFAFLAYSF